MASTINFHLKTYEVPPQLKDKEKDKVLPAVEVNFTTKKIRMTSLPDITARVTLEASLLPEFVKETKSAELNDIADVFWDNISHLMFNHIWIIDHEKSSIVWSADNTSLSIDIIFIPLFIRDIPHIPSPEELLKTLNDVKFMLESLSSVRKWVDKGVFVLDGEVHFSVTVSASDYEVEVKTPFIKWSNEMEEWDKKRWFGYIVAAVTLTPYHDNSTFEHFVTRGSQNLDSVIIYVVRRKERKVF